MRRRGLTTEAYVESDDRKDIRPKLTMIGNHFVHRGHVHMNMYAARDRGASKVQIMIS